MSYVLAVSPDKVKQQEKIIQDYMVKLDQKDREVAGLSNRLNVTERDTKLEEQISSISSLDGC